MMKLTVIIISVMVERNLSVALNVVNALVRSHICRFVHFVLNLFRYSICKKHFSQRKSFDDMKTQGGGKPFSIVCGKCLISKCQLQEQKRKHTGEKPFSCPVYDKSFHREAHLERHMITHKLGKPFSCSVCRKSFVCKSTLQGHNTFHTREKPFCCCMCDKSFFRKAHLQRHMKTHTGEKPFSCSVCNKGFVGKISLQRHMRTHTGAAGGEVACSTITDKKQVRDAS
uniref:C2H2-type domain-containing protein n=1 Tax=Dicentrarchus labrax TaxID=13489 RepID=A0A8P4KLE4_DICLA